MGSIQHIHNIATVQTLLGAAYTELLPHRSNALYPGEQVIQNLKGRKNYGGRGDVTCTTMGEILQLCARQNWNSQLCFCHPKSDTYPNPLTITVVPNASGVLGRA